MFNNVLRFEIIIIIYNLSLSLIADDWNEWKYPLAQSSTQNAVSNLQYPYNLSRRFSALRFIPKLKLYPFCVLKSFEASKQYEIQLRYQAFCIYSFKANIKNNSMNADISIIPNDMNCDFVSMYSFESLHSNQ